MFLSVGEAAINDPGVSMESSQFSSEVLVTQVSAHNSVLSFTPAPSFGWKLIQNINMSKIPITANAKIGSYLLLVHYPGCTGAAALSVYAPERAATTFSKPKCQLLDDGLLCSVEKSPPQQLSKLHFMYVRGTAIQQMIFVFSLIHLPAFPLLSFDCVDWGVQVSQANVLKKGPRITHIWEDLVLFGCLFTCCCIFINALHAVKVGIKSICPVTHWKSFF